MSEPMEPLRFIAAIVERGQGAPLRQFLLSPAYQLRCLWQSTGRGTASSELLNVLGIGTPERDIVMALATGPSTRNLFRKLGSGLDANTHTRGIAFALRLSAVSGLMAAALKHLETLEVEKGETAMDEIQHTLILVLVNMGYTDEVMATAREAGARGGTVVRARWAGDDEVHGIMGITVQTERELLAIVASQRDRAAIMEAVNQKHGMKQDAQAVVCALPVEYLSRLG